MAQKTPTFTVDPQELRLDDVRSMLNPSQKQVQPPTTIEVQIPTTSEITSMAGRNNQLSNIANGTTSYGHRSSVSGSIMGNRRRMVRPTMNMKWMMTKDPFAGESSDIIS